MIGRDLLLIAISLTGIVGGISMPETAAVFSPYVLQCMMVILFLSFFAARFFGPTEPLMAAAYLLPLNVMPLPIRYVVQRETTCRRH